MRHSALHGVNVPADRATSMIDEFPILSVIATMAEGTTVMNGVAELRVKDPTASTPWPGPARQWGRGRWTRDGMTVHGKGRDQGGAEAVATHLDHRIAMSFMVAGLATDKITVDDGAAIATSFPDFVPLIQGLGADLARS